MAMLTKNLTVQEKMCLVLCLCAWWA